MKGQPFHRIAAEKSNSPDQDRSQRKAQTRSLNKTHGRPGGQRQALVCKGSLFNGPGHGYRDEKDEKFQASEREVSPRG